ncbi:MAG: tripartite tricarboxylate transporter permease [Thermanaeromonas sp.]|uniref:tripartite tricarboxylate transporter permease n=1 Tax=Thermanaeromonas sp. TaxID=2003697 RepID=UPI002438EC4E|nr:tripartite tricarboxylate transporter permease [Thermanaeromonas sp.]MCG0277181.1 tripartite tricarboxylate transporter permease [Thermanaeromonas sp.]
MSVLSALEIALTPYNLLACFVGVLVGTLTGVLPGLGPAAAMALLLPLTVKLGPTAGLIMLAGIYYGAMYGGSTTSILVNVPGEPASVVTCLEGYKLAQKGRAGAALAVSALGSFVAGTIGIVLLQLFAPPLAKAALAFGPAEFFALTVVGVIVLSNLSGKGGIKAFLMIALGLLLSTVGLDPLGGVNRFTFNQPLAGTGLSFIAIAAGLFGVGEILWLASQPEEKIEPVAKVRLRDLYPTKEEIKRALPSMFRGTLLGFLIGLIPGPSATIASFASYSLEKSTSKHKEEFGNGAIEGVAGPESANNAASVGAMIPLLSLGIPFSPAIAVLLSGMLLVGVTPGPLFLREHPDAFWGVIGSMYIGNIMLLILNLPLVGIWASITRIPYKYLMPVVLLFCIVGAYADNNNIFDVWVMLAAGVAGYLMRKYEYDPAPLLIGLVMGPIMERSLRQALIMGRGDLAIFVASPISLAMYAMALALVVFMLVKKPRVMSAD